MSTISFNLISIFFEFIQAQVADNDHDEDLDMSREKARTYKIVGLDVMRRIASSIISFATGYVIRYAGFFYTLVIVLCCKVLLMVFAYVFVTETGEQKKTGGFMAPLRYTIPSNPLSFSRTS